MSRDPRSADRLLGKQVAFTGRLASLTRKEAADLVGDFGGLFVRSPSRRTSLLVVGQEGWPLDEDGRLTRKLRKALSLKERGSSIEIVTEEEFLRRLGLSDLGEEVHRLYTAAQLGRILGLPRDRLRLWIRIGLIRPIRSAHRLSYFDFSRVAGAKRLCELMRSGVTVERLRRSLLQLRAWSADADLPLSQLPLLAREGRLHLRLRSGQVAEPSGQLLFDFACDQDGTGAPAGAILDLKPGTADGWFELALRLEDAGRLEEAAEAYREALLLAGPQPELCFNLGNVLHALGRKDQALERFFEAVELDPDYAEAWNNMGNLLGDLGQVEKAIEVYRRALVVEPDYAEAHFNLAEALHEAGCEVDARSHWRAYLGRDPASPWAERARRRLGK